MLAVTPLEPRDVMQIVGLDLCSLRPGRLRALEDALAPTELRALRAQPPRHRAAWTAGRLALKLAAGSYACKPWHQVETGHLETGQPRIVDPAAPGCSLSHSGRVVVAAVASDAVGVDVERIRSRDRALLDHIVDEDELAIFTRDPDRSVDSGPDRDELVTSLWTIKEAALKWGGWGLSIPIRGARILHRPGRGRVNVHIRWQEVDGEITVWTTRVRGYSLSIASNDPNPLGSIRWDPPLRLPAG